MAVYVSDLLTATAATVDVAPSSTRTWQWLRGSTSISGATTNAYTATFDDIGSVISVSQTEANFLGVATASSAATETVEAYNPAALFRSSEPGVWFDPNDITTLYKGPTGVAPVTAPGDTVWTMLDKSRGGPGPELVVNGNFSSGATGWTTQAGWSISAGALNAVAAANGSSAFQTLSGLKPSTPYRITFEVSNYSAGFVYAQFFSGVAGDWLSGNGQKSIILTTPVSVANTNFGITSVFSTFTGTIDNISVKELPGNHATQPTLASQPTYGIVPAGGRRNILTYTEQFSNSIWAYASSTASVTDNAALSPVGTLTASQISFTGSNSNGDWRYYSGAPIPAGSTFSIWLRVASGTRAVALRTWETGIASAVTVTTAWQRFTLAVPSQENTGLGLDNRSAYGAAGTAGAIFAWGAQVETGSLATPYQRVGTTYDVTEAGVPSLGYLYFDGASDSMSTPTITSGTDKAQVFSGMRTNSNGGLIFAELSANSFTNAGSFLVGSGSWVQGGNRIGGGVTGSTLLGYDSPASFTFPLTAVATHLYDIAGATASAEAGLRINGVAQTLSYGGTGSAGTGSFGNYPLYIGARNNASLYFQGNLFPLIVRFGTNLTAARITSTENWVSTQTPLFWTVGSGFWNNSYPWSDISAWND